MEADQDSLTDRLVEEISANIESASISVSSLSWSPIVVPGLESQSGWPSCVSINFCLSSRDY